MASLYLNCLLKTLLISFSGATILATHASPVIDLEARQLGSLPAGWSFIGCYSDDISSRTLQGTTFTDNHNMTIESCIAFCTASGNKYAGVEFAQECYCDVVIESPGEPISSSTCSMACTGNAGEICGGPLGIDIFENPSIIAPTIKQTAGTFQYTGCYQDGVDQLPRSLVHQLLISGGVTAESCTAACKAAGFLLAGLEFGQECWCASYMSLAVLTPDTDCNMVCKADSTEFCGAGNRLAVYVDSTVPPLDLQTCLNDAQFQHPDPPEFTFDLEAIFVPAFPGAPVNAAVLLGNSPEPSNPKIQILTERPANNVHTYGISSSGGPSPLFTTTHLPGLNEASSLRPIPGGPQIFQVDFVGPANLQDDDYCAFPNPLSASTYIGPPILAIAQRTDVWSLCPQGLTFMRNATSGACSDVLVAMTPPIV